MRMIDSLEPRRLLAWSTYATLMGQDALAAARPSLNGAGQVVAVLDTGTDYNHPTLGGGFGKTKKVIAGYDFIQNDGDPQDSDGHGTNVAGFIAGNEFTYQGKTYRGIAPNAKIISLRVGTGRNSYDTNNIERALQWIIQNKTKWGITVANLSLGGGLVDDYYSDPQTGDEFATLKSMGVFCVVSAGNEYSNAMASPGSDPSVFNSGSVTANDVISDFSNRNQILDLLAPGEQVVGPKRFSTTYEAVDGTSFSAPITAGAVALIKQLAPTLSVDDIASVLRTSSVPNRDGDAETNAPTSRVYGRLDLVAAMNLAEIRNSANLTVLSSSKQTTIDTAYDKSGVLHLAYYDPSTRKLMYTSRNEANSLWNTPVVVDSSNADLGQHLSLAIDQAGRPAIAYFDSTNADLKYATLNQGTHWSTRVIDSNKSTGQFPSLVFNAVGNPQIAYYYKSSGRLRLASFNSTSNTWGTSTIDATADVGTYASLAFEDSGGDGTLAVAYADQTNGDLKYARYDTTATPATWLIAKVDNLAGVGSIDLTLSNGAARIAYQDLLLADVKFAYKDTNWFPAKVAEAGNVGKNIRTYFDASDGYHIVYYNQTKDGTYDALINETTHKVTSTARVGTVGRTASVAVSRFGNVTLVGLNRAGKQMYATEIVDGV